MTSPEIAHDAVPSGSRQTFIVHYSEVALKGKNRSEFVRTLRRNLTKALWGLEPMVTLTEGRFMVTASGAREEVARRIGRTFGVAWYAPAVIVEPHYEVMLRQVLQMARDEASGTFKIEARRADKNFPMSSQELARRLGASVVEETGMKVDLSHPDLAVHVDVTRFQAIIYSKKQPGPGGLPVGTAGRVLHLFSGGIDSPVAAWLLMKRGCVPVYLHFYLAPTTKTVIESKITGLVKVLADYGGRSTLVLLPFADYQLATADTQFDLEPSLFRRFMRMTAEALAPMLGATAISTGDSLSQAASQTLWNMAAIDQGSALPNLRPLLTYDKEEIVSLAKRINTYDLSIEEYKDCCAIITRHPKTRIRPGAIDEEVGRLKLQDLVWRVIDSATLVTFSPSSGTMKATRFIESVPGVPLPKADL